MSLNALILGAAGRDFHNFNAYFRGNSEYHVVAFTAAQLHGGMPFGSGWIGARRYGAAEVVDPRPYAIGSIRETFEAYPEIGPVLPAMGYGDEQVAELQETIASVPADLVLVASPIDLRRLIDMPMPALRARYELQEIGQPDLEAVLQAHGLLSAAIPRKLGAT